MHSGPWRVTEACGADSCYLNAGSFYTDQAATQLNEFWVALPKYHENAVHRFEGVHAVLGHLRFFPIEGHRQMPVSMFVLGARWRMLQPRGSWRVQGLFWCCCCDLARNS